jgi:hypothetical protein
MVLTVNKWTSRKEFSILSEKLGLTLEQTLQIRNFIDNIYSKLAKETVSLKKYTKTKNAKIKLENEVKKIRGDYIKNKYCMKILNNSIGVINE